MSYDFALEQVCTHEVKFERAAFAPGTFDTVRFSRPPSNSNVTLYVDGLEVPPTGLSSVPSLPMARGEPYRFVAGQSDLLYVKIGAGSARIVQLLTGNGVRAADLVRDLAIKVPELALSAQEGRVVFQSKDSGAASSVFSFPDPRWTDRTSSLPTTARILGGFRQAGIVPGRMVTSRRVFPSWSLVQDPTTPIAGVPQILFSAPVPNANPVLHVGYFTDSSNCRRCHGTRIEFDYNLKNGTYETVSGADLLSQEFDKFLFTRAGTHFKWPWLGSRLIDRIGGKNVSTGVTASALITLDVSQAFRTYQSIKTQQDQTFPFQQISDEEFPLSLGEVVVKSPPGDPTVAIVVATIASRSRQPITLKRVVGTPNPFVLSAGAAGFRLRGG